jgi:hypothetical protein
MIRFLTHKFLLGQSSPKASGQDTFSQINYYTSFFSFSPYPFSHWGHFNGSLLYGRSPAAKKLQRSNGRSLSASGRKWLAIFIVDLNRPSDLSFGRCDKEWDANWSRGVTGIFRRTCVSGQNIPHTQKNKIVLYFQRFSKMYFKLKAGRWPEKVQGQIHLLGYGQRFFFLRRGGIFDLKIMIF